jgi:two-component system, NtrC family, sensor histidine kinase HydH
VNRRILILVTAPAVLIAVVLSGACLITAWYVSRVQANLADMLAQNVASMQAAQQMEISLRQLRFHCFLSLIDPTPTLSEDIRADQHSFQKWLATAEQTSFTEQEHALVRTIREGYDRYRREFAHLREDVARKGARRDFRELADFHPIRHVVDPCREYLRVNEEMVAQASQDTSRLSHQLRLLMLLLGVGGPLGGLLGGYGIARGLTRSLHRLSVRVQDVAQQLEQDVAQVSLVADGDFGHLDRQLQYVVRRVAEVTERAQQQQREVLRAQQMAAVGQLAASVAHEVRNPLTAIKMLTEAASTGERPRPFTADNLRVVHGEVLRLERTVQNFLNFARPAKPQRRDCDLGAVVKQATDLVQARARQQRSSLLSRYPERPIRACVDSDQLCSVLVNLLMNALDAVADGGVIEVELACTDAGVRLTVADTGPGIAADMTGRLFAPYATTKPTGSGLGLSISKRIVEEHGGTIAAANGVHGGARFTITLPRGSEEDHHANPAGDR